MADDTGQLSELLDLVKGLVADQDEIKTEVARLQALNAQKPEPVPSSAILSPSGAKSPPELDNGNGTRMRFFNVDTDAEYDPRLRVEMWRPDKIITCPCGQESYAETHSIMGELNILDAQRPKVTPKGEVYREPYRFMVHPQTGEDLIPVELQRTPEKVAHFVECAQKAQGKNRRLQRFIKKNMATIETAVDELPEDLDNGPLKHAAAFHQEQIADV